MSKNIVVIQTAFIIDQHTEAKKPIKAAKQRLNNAA